MTDPKEVVTEEIKDLARQAAWEPWINQYEHDEIADAVLAVAAPLIAKAVQERCAQTVEAQALMNCNVVHEIACDDIAAAIRALDFGKTNG